MIPFSIKHSVAIVLCVAILVGLGLFIKNEKSKSYESGKAEIQKVLDDYKREALQKENQLKTEAIAQSTKLNKDWELKLKEQHEKQIKLESTIASINNSNNRLSEQIRAFSSRTKSRHDSASAANIESKTCWTLFENRRRVDSDRIKDAERINDELVLAKKYIETIREYDAEE